MKERGRTWPQKVFGGDKVGGRGIVGGLRQRKELTMERPGKRMSSPTKVNQVRLPVIGVRASTDARP